MNVYVAGAYCDKPTVQRVQSELKTIGCWITHDWTTASNGNALEDAIADEGGVNRADVVVLVFSVAQHAYRGTFTEMGMALALRKMVFALSLVDGDYKHNPFLQLPQVRTAYSLDELVNLVKNISYEERLQLFIQKPRFLDEHICNHVPIQLTSDESDECDKTATSDDTGTHES